MNKIVGIILIVVGAAAVFYGGQHVMDLMNQGSSKLVDMAYQVQGSSLIQEWAKYGGLTLAGIIAIFYGIKAVK